MVCPFSLECPEEGLDDCVVPAVAFSTHAMLEMALSDHVPISVATELGPTIRVDHQTRGGLTGMNGTRQSRESPFVTQVFPERPTDNPSGIQIDDNGQIEPALTATKIDDITDPYFVWMVYIEPLLKQVRSGLQLVVGVCGDHESSTRFGPQALATHGSGH